PAWGPWSAGTDDLRPCSASPGRDAPHGLPWNVPWQARTTPRSGWTWHSPVPLLHPWPVGTGPWVNSDMPGRGQDRRYGPCSSTGTALWWRTFPTTTTRTRWSPAPVRQKPWSWHANTAWQWVW